MIKGFYQVLLLVCLSLLSVTSLTAQQQAQFSLASFQPSLYNPAVIAEHQNVIFMGGRNQWSKLEGAPRTIALSAEAQIRSVQNRQNTRVALRAQTDKIGIFSNQSVGLLVARPLKVLKHKIHLGGGLEYSFLNADYSQLILQNPNDPVLTEGANFHRLAYRAGIQVSKPLYFLGASMMSGFLESDLIGYPDLGNQFIAMGGLHLRKDKRVSWHPGVVVKQVYNAEMKSPASIESFLYVNLPSQLQVGAFMRYQESVSLLVTIPLSTDVSFSYAYDYGINQLTDLYAGTHEFWIRFNIDQRSLKPVLNPRNFMQL